MIQVVKADGQLQQYSKSKIESSLKRAGADDNTINMIVKAVESQLYNKIPSSKIYDLIYAELDEESKSLRYKYNLKQSIMKLGPTGYPFEKFIAGVLKQYGYKTTVGQVVQGKCIHHELDVIMEKDSVRCMLECKFHNHPGTKSGVKDILYTHARFQDVKETNNLDEAWLVTNTKATKDAIEYAQCSAMRVVSWNYPQDLSLREMIERSGLHPITSRSDLTEIRVKELLIQGVVFAKDIPAS